jgi:hypothetical protein
MDIINELEKKANIEMIKYLCGKQIWCDYSNNMLDYRNAIMIELMDKSGITQSKVVHGSFEGKIPQIKKAFKNKGLEVVITKNIVK